MKTKRQCEYVDAPYRCMKDDGHIGDHVSHGYDRLGNRRDVPLPWVRTPIYDSVRRDLDVIAEEKRQTELELIRGANKELFGGM